MITEAENKSRFALEGKTTVCCSWLDDYSRRSEGNDRHM